MTVIPCWLRVRRRVALTLATLSLSTLAGIAFAGLASIWGTPPTTAVVGQPYLFVPHASDPDGDRLIFWLHARPAWIAFDWRTGTMSGTPGPNDIGTYRDIRVGVSDSPDPSRVDWLAPFDLTVESGDQRPVISGTPPTSVVVGQAYSFQPEASDPDGDTLFFWIKNRPPWAALDRATGRLYGTPDGGDVGPYDDIVISANDGSRNAPLPAFSIAVLPVGGGSVTLSWTPPTTRTDGSALTNLAGYRILWGTAKGSYPNGVTISNPGLTSYVVSNLAPATYYFVITAFDEDGVESGYSNSASKTVK